MNKKLSKRLIWLLLIVLTPVLILIAINLLGRVVEYAGKGADRASALNIVPSLPSDLPERLIWLPDASESLEGEQIGRFTRDKVALDYLRAWAQLNISYAIGEPHGLRTYFTEKVLDTVSTPIVEAAAGGWKIEQENLQHVLELRFFSADRSVIAFRDHDVRLVQHLLHEDSGIERVVESDSVYDVVMFLEDGNWRIRFWQRQGDVADGFPLSSVEQRASQRPITDATQTDRSGPKTRELSHSVSGLNYYPQASPWTKFWPEYDPDQTQIDLERMAGLGINTVRAFLPFSDFTDEELGGDHIESLTDFLDQAEEQNIDVIVTLFDHRTDHRLANWSADDRFLAAVIPSFANHPAILAWDLKNEPDRDYDFNGRQLVQAWLRHVAREIRRYDPEHLITIGWSSPEAATELADIVDFVSYHYFDAPDEYEERVQALQDSVPGKLLMLQEFALSTWNSFFPGGHSEQEQAVYYADMLAAHRSFDTAGYMAWTLYDFDSVPLPEFRLPWQKRHQAHMGIVRHDGTLKPAAQLLHPDSSLAVAAIPRWQSLTKPFRLLVAMLAMLALLSLWGIRYRYKR